MQAEEISARAKAGVWQTISEAIKGTHQDFTRLSISRAVFLLAIPMVLEMLMESLFAVVDVFWVSRLGANAIATVGLTESMLSLVFSVALGVSLSTTAMVARRIGEKDPEGAATAAMQSIFLGIGVALAMGIPGMIFAHGLLHLMGADQMLIAGGHRYTEIVFGGTTVVMLLFLNNAIFRGAGDASIAMRVLWVSNLINLLLDPCFIFGLGPFPKLGVTGAATATLIGRSCGVVYQFWMLTNGSARVHLTARHLRLAPDVIGSLIRVSSTGVLQFLIAHTSWIVLVRIISTFGSLAVAGYTIGIRIFMFIILPSWGLSGAAATMVGQNLGAKKPERAERAVYVTGGYNAIYLVSIAAVLIFAPHLIVSFFSADPVVSNFASDCLRIIGYGNLSYAFGMVMIQAFNGSGDTVTPTLINIVSFWLCEIPLGWFLANHTGLGVDGVFTAIPVANTVMAVISLLVFARGRWKLRRI
ncbi:MAG: MATE family efflux transporter [Acidobacteriaceae bacterium]|nr:MATE family efflux transporter [Acidobacteriaceae bacterium]MBV9765992.1 MATE family efflux transporter [Acidobacteriaceae bacterium]